MNPRLYLIKINTSTIHQPLKIIKIVKMMLLLYQITKILIAHLFFVPQKHAILLHKFIMK